MAVRATSALLLLVAMLASYALIVSQRNARNAPRLVARQAASTPASSLGVQLTPAPGIAVTIAPSPTHGASSSSSTSVSSSTGASSATTGYVVPPRYPTPAPTADANSGGGHPPTATSSVSVWRPGPTPTATPPLLDDAQVVSYSPTGPITGNNPTINYSVTLTNSGASTWDSPTNYMLKCVQYCGSTWNAAPRYSWPVAPGQQMLFTGTESILSGSMYSVNTIIWQLWSAYSGYFGQQIKITVIHDGWYLDFQEASPSCMDDGTLWATRGSNGTATCGSSGLAMAQGGSNGIGLDLQGTPASYDAGNYSAKVHVHFDTSSNALFAGVIITERAATAPSRLVVMVSPAGYVCYQSNTAYCLPGYSPQTIPVSSDYDITVTVAGNGTTVSAVYSPGAYFEGGISAGGLTGLIEVNGSGVTDAAYFTNYKFYQYK